MGMHSVPSTQVPGPWLQPELGAPSSHASGCTGAGSSPGPPARATHEESAVAVLAAKERGPEKSEAARACPEGSGKPVSSAPSWEGCMFWERGGNRLDKEVNLQRTAKIGDVPPEDVWLSPPGATFTGKSEVLEPHSTKFNNGDVKEPY